MKNEFRDGMALGQQAPHARPDPGKDSDRERTADRITGKCDNARSRRGFRRAEQHPGTEGRCNQRQRDDSRTARARRADEVLNGKDAAADERDADECKYDDGNEQHDQSRSIGHDPLLQHWAQSAPEDPADRGYGQ
jgi:hypothetical protein